MATAERQREWYKKNPGRSRAYTVKWQQKYPERYARIAKAGYEKLVGSKEGVARRMIYKARERNRKTVAIIHTDILTIWPINDKCPVFGVPFAYGRRVDREAHPNSPSLDRIDPIKGYVVGNIAVISWRANAVKRDATIKELEAVAAWLKGLK